MIIWHGSRLIYYMTVTKESDSMVFKGWNLKSIIHTTIPPS